MSKIRGTYLSHRSKAIPNSRRGTSFSTVQLAYIPQSDPDGFPAVLNVDASVSGVLDKLAAGQLIEGVLIQTPPYGDSLVTELAAG